jgi:hypothetical protein
MPSKGIENLFAATKEMRNSQRHERAESTKVKISKYNGKL